MPLRLFRTTGHADLRMPGEARLGMHPAWLVLAVSLWLALACNVGVWRLLAGREEAPMVLATIALVAGGSAAVLGLLGWRRTVRPAATLLLLAGGLLACGLWVQDLPLESLWQERPPRLLPSWASFLRASVVLLVVVLALLPIVWVWTVRLRRLPASAQLRGNLVVVVLGMLACAAGVVLLP